MGWNRSGAEPDLVKMRRFAGRIANKLGFSKGNRWDFTEYTGNRWGFVGNPWDLAKIIRNPGMVMNQRSPAGS